MAAKTCREKNILKSEEGSGCRRDSETRPFLQGIAVCAARQFFKIFSCFTASGVKTTGAIENGRGEEIRNRGSISESFFKSEMSAERCHYSRWSATINIFNSVLLLYAEMEIES